MVLFVPRLPCKLDNFNYVEHTCIHLALSLKIDIVIFMLCHYEVMEGGGGLKLNNVTNSLDKPPKYTNTHRHTYSTQANLSGCCIQSAMSRCLLCKQFLSDRQGNTAWRHQFTTILSLSVVTNYRLQGKAYVSCDLKATNLLPPRLRGKCFDHLKLITGHSTHVYAHTQCNMGGTWSCNTS